MISPGKSWALPRLLVLLVDRSGGRPSRLGFAVGWPEPLGSLGCLVWRFGVNRRIPLSHWLKDPEGCGCFIQFEKPCLGLGRAFQSFRAICGSFPGCRHGSKGERAPQTENARFQACQVICRPLKGENFEVEVAAEAPSRTSLESGGLCTCRVRGDLSHTESLSYCPCAGNGCRSQEGCL